MLKTISFLCAMLLAATVQANTSPSANRLAESLKQAIYQQDATAIQQLLPQYQQQNQPDPILIEYAQAKLAFIAQDYVLAIRLYRHILSQRPELHSIRMELAMTLFADQQDNVAKQQFTKVRTVQGLPQSAYERIDRYLNALDQRNQWQIDFNVAYVKTDNVQNTSHSQQIENTGFVKNTQMLPSKAEGFKYNLNLNRDINLTGSHYATFSNEHWGRIYWNNHRFDEISNRTLLGYAYKQKDYSLRLQPFYDKRWYAQHSQHWSNGVQLQYSHWLNPHWQNHFHVEFEQRRFFDFPEQNGRIRTLSNNLAWYPNPQQLFYFGVTFSREDTAERQYSSDVKNLRLGWLQEYGYGISSRLSSSFSLRQFKDEAVLANILPLGKTRRDKIYQMHLQLWKRDWHLWGITPKWDFSWKKQQSNLSTLYSYQDHQITLVFEKRF